MAWAFNWKARGRCFRSKDQSRDQLICPRAKDKTKIDPSPQNLELSFHRVKVTHGPLLSPSCHHHPSVLRLHHPTSPHPSPNLYPPFPTSSSYPDPRHLQRWASTQSKFHFLQVLSPDSNLIHISLFKTTMQPALFLHAPLKCLSLYLYMWGELLDVSLFLHPEGSMRTECIRSHNTSFYRRSWHSQCSVTICYIENSGKHPVSHDKIRKMNKCIETTDLLHSSSSSWLQSCERNMWAVEYLLLIKW